MADYRYDPHVAPQPEEWLAVPEVDRLGLVDDHHRGVTLPNRQLHAAIHVVVENQLALGEPVVRETLARLQSDGLDRHDAIHAIGAQLAECLYEVMDQREEVSRPAYAGYLGRLQKLSAASWRVG